MNVTSNKVMLLLCKLEQIMRCLHEMLILSFSYIVSSSSRKICVGFSANLVNKIRSNGCWQNFICPTLAILQFSLCNNEISMLKINTVHYRERERGKVLWNLQKLFLFNFFPLKVVRCKIPRGTLYIALFFPPCFLPLIYSSNKHNIPGVLAEIFK